MIAIIYIPYWLLLTLAAIIVLAVFLIFFWLNKMNKELNNIIRKTDEMDIRIETEKLKFKQQLDLIFDSIKDGILVVDEYGIILHANTTIKKWFNLPESIVEKNMSNILTAPLLETFTKLLHSDNPDAETDIELKNPINCNLHIERSAIKRESGGIYGIVFIVRDQTRLMTLEKTRQEFVANVSHELRTPLTLIKGYVETLLDGAKNDPQASTRFLQTIKKHSDRLNFLIDDLLTISTLESGQVKLNFQTHKLREIVNDVITDLKVRAEERNTIIHNQLDDTIDAIVDSERIKQVFYNLIDNAIKYGKNGGNVWIECQKMNRH
ncbi:MAG TPA: histidine kinase dimerization/phospho-acceptor domain-containing protein [Verrucomicrobiota bacterium]|nr:histidine kinase dimerization/phospho-acceptor domain-containing protein [Verrucomicrobiota bacterium]